MQQLRSSEQFQRDVKSSHICSTSWCIFKILWDAIFFQSVYMVQPITSTVFHSYCTLLVLSKCRHLCLGLEVLLLSQITKKKKKKKKGIPVEPNLLYFVVNVQVSDPYIKIRTATVLQNFEFPIFIFKFILTVPPICRYLISIFHKCKVKMSLWLN
jgi:hypothetical protein